MLLTPWLTLLRSAPVATDTAADRRAPQRPDRATRFNPFRPPVRNTAGRGIGNRPSALRWLLHQRQF